MLLQAFFFKNVVVFCRKNHKNVIGLQFDIVCILSGTVFQSISTRSYCLLMPLGL